MHQYEVRPRKDKRGVDLISDALFFGRLWYDTPDNAIGYAMHSSRSHDAVIRVYDDAGNVIETHEHTGEFKECASPINSRQSGADKVSTHVGEKRGRLIVPASPIEPEGKLRLMNLESAAEREVAVHNHAHDVASL